MEPVCDKQNNPLTSWLASIWVTVSLLLRCRWLSNTLREKSFKAVAPNVFVFKLPTRQNERAWKKHFVSCFVLNGVCISGVITYILICNPPSPGHATQCVRQTHTCESSVSWQMWTSVKCTGWTKGWSCVSTSVWMSQARTTAPAPAATSCSLIGGAARVSDWRLQGTRAHSKGPIWRSAWVCSSREGYWWFRKMRKL